MILEENPISQKREVGFYICIVRKKNGRLMGK